MIHRFVDLPETALPILPMLSNDFVAGQFVIWEIGNQATPVRVTSTQNSFSGNNIADPQISPDGTEFVYSVVGSAAGSINSVRLCAWDQSSDVQIATAPNASASGYSLSLQPAWHPGGTKLVYRDTSLILKIKSVDRDGTNATVLYTAPSNNYRLFNPLYSADGNYIVFTSYEDFNPTPVTVAKKYRIHVMEADGSNETVVVGPFSGAAGDTIPLIHDTVAWMNGANTLAYLRYLSGSSYTANWEWHSVDFDGSNDTTLHTINRAGYTFAKWDPGPIYGSWLADDSGLMTFLLDLGTGIHEMTVIGAGGGATGTGLFVDLGGFADDDSRPLVFQGRIYYPLGVSNAQTEVQSVAVGSTTSRTEFDGTTYDPDDDVNFQGFRGVAD